MRAVVPLANGALVSAGEDNTLHVLRTLDDTTPLILSDWSLEDDGKITSAAALGPERVVAGSADGKLRIWNVTTATCERTIKVAAGSAPAAVDAIAVLGAGTARPLLVASCGGRVRMFDSGIAGGSGAAGELRTGLGGGAPGAVLDELLGDVPGSPAPASDGAPVPLPRVHALLALPDGRLASAGDDGVRIWAFGEADTSGDDAAAGAAAGGGVLAGFGALAGLAAAGGIRHVCELRMQAEAQGHSHAAAAGHGYAGAGSMLSLCLMQDGRLAAGAADGRVYVWWLPAPLAPAALAAAVAGRAARAAGRGAGAGAGAMPLQLQVHPRPTVLTGHKAPVLSLASGGPGKLLSGSADGHVRLWSVPRASNTGLCLVTVSRHAGPVTALHVQAASLTMLHQHQQQHAGAGSDASSAMVSLSLRFISGGAPRWTPGPGESADDDDAASAAALARSSSGASSAGASGASGAGELLLWEAELRGPADVLAGSALVDLTSSGGGPLQLALAYGETGLGHAIAHGDASVSPSRGLPALRDGSAAPSSSSSAAGAGAGLATGAGIPLSQVRASCADGVLVQERSSNSSGGGSGTGGAKAGPAASRSRAATASAAAPAPQALMHLPVDATAPLTPGSGGGPARVTAAAAREPRGSSSLNPSATSSASATADAAAASAYAAAAGLFDGPEAAQTAGAFFAHGVPGSQHLGLGLGAGVGGHVPEGSPLALALHAEGQRRGSLRASSIDGTGSAAEVGAEGFWMSLASQGQGQGEFDSYADGQDRDAAGAAGAGGIWFDGSDSSSAAASSAGQGKGKATGQLRAFYARKSTTVLHTSSAPLPPLPAPVSSKQAADATGDGWRNGPSSTSTAASAASRSSRFATHRSELVTAGPGAGLYLAKQVAGKHTQGPSSDGSAAAAAATATSSASSSSSSSSLVPLGGRATTALIFSPQMQQLAGAGPGLGSARAPATVVSVGQHHGSASPPPPPPPPLPIGGLPAGAAAGVGAGVGGTVAVMMVMSEPSGSSSSSGTGSSTAGFGAASTAGSGAGSFDTAALRARRAVGSESAFAQSPRAPTGAPSASGRHGIAASAGSASSHGFGFTAGPLSSASSSSSSAMATGMDAYGYLPVPAGLLVPASPVSGGGLTLGLDRAGLGHDGGLLPLSVPAPAPAGPQPMDEAGTAAAIDAALALAIPAVTAPLLVADVAQKATMAAGSAALDRSGIVAGQGSAAGAGAGAPGADPHRFTASQASRAVFDFAYAAPPMASSFHDAPSSSLALTMASFRDGFAAGSSALTSVSDRERERQHEARMAAAAAEAAGREWAVAVATQGFGAITIVDPHAEAEGQTEGQAGTEGRADGQAEGQASAAPDARRRAAAAAAVAAAKAAPAAASRASQLARAAAAARARTGAAPTAAPAAAAEPEAAAAEEPVFSKRALTTAAAAVPAAPAAGDTLPYSHFRMASDGQLTMGPASASSPSASSSFASSSAAPAAAVSLASTLSLRRGLDRTGLEVAIVAGAAAGDAQAHVAAALVDDAPCEGAGLAVGALAATAARTRSEALARAAAAVRAKAPLTGAVASPGGGSGLCVRVGSGDRVRQFMPSAGASLPLPQEAQAVAVAVATKPGGSNDGDDEDEAQQQQMALTLPLAASAPLPASPARPALQDAAAAAVAASAAVNGLVSWLATSEADAAEAAEQEALEAAAAAAAAAEAAAAANPFALASVAGSAPVRRGHGTVGRVFGGGGGGLSARSEGSLSPRTASGSVRGSPTGPSGSAAAKAPDALTLSPAAAAAVRLEATERAAALMAPPPPSAPLSSGAPARMALLDAERRDRDADAAGGVRTTVFSFRERAPADVEAQRATASPGAAPGANTEPRYRPLLKVAAKPDATVAIVAQVTGGTAPRT